MTKSIKVRFSKEDWQKIGSKSGWLEKDAFAYPFSEKQQEEMAQEGLHSKHDFEDSLPYGGIKDLRGMMESSGAKSLFSGDYPRIRKFFIPQDKNIVTINDSEYYLVDVEKSGKKKDGKVVVMGPLERDDEGEVVKKRYQEKTMSYNEVGSQIKRSPVIVQRNVAKVNKFIDKYNSFVDRQLERGYKGGNITNLPLQIQWAEDLVDDRLSELDAQIQAIASKGAASSEKGDIGNKALEETMQGVRSGAITDISPEDYAILLLERKYHSIPSLKELRNEIESERMPFDEKTNSILKNFLGQVIDWQINLREQKIQEDKAKGEARQERIENVEKDGQELPEMKRLFLDKVQHISDLPGQFSAATKFYSTEGFATSAAEAQASIKRDLEELTSIKNSLQKSKQEIIDLPSKKGSYLRGEGADSMADVKEFMNAAKAFIARYNINPFVETEGGLEVNQAILGREGTLGNALVAIVLRQVILSVNKEIDRISGVGSQAPATSEVPSQAPAPVEAKSVEGIEKMSSYLMQAFEKRMGK